MSGRIFLVAAESSGDALGADLARALKERDATLELHAVGGERIAEAGVPTRTDITTGLAVLGLVDGLLAYNRVKRAVTATVAAILEAKPDVVVLIDSWGFTLRVAQAVRAAAPNIKLAKYVGPQVWATRPGRAKTLAAAVDHLICIHDFEVPFYQPFGLPCTVCGHPAFGRYTPGDGAALRARQGFTAKEKIILILPGSRPSEIRRVGPTLWAAAESLDRDRDVRLIVVAANSVRAQVLAQTPAAARIIDEREKEDAFAAATVALATSGTVTTEVALQGTPLVIGYKFGWITWAILRMLVKTKYGTLMNVAADAEVAPEFVQTRFTPENVAQAAAPLLDDEDAREEQVRRQDEALALMGRGGRPAAEIAADAVLAVKDQRLSHGT